MLYVQNSENYEWKHPKSYVLSFIRLRNNDIYASIYRVIR